MCCSYQFLQCFVGFERCKQRTRARSRNARKSMGFGLQNRARERPGDRKSSPGGPVRATKREKVARSSAIFWKAGANGPVGAKKARPRPPKERKAPNAPGTGTPISIRMYTYTGPGMPKKNLLTFGSLFFFFFSFSLTINSWPRKVFFFLTPNFLEGVFLFFRGHRGVRQ